MRKLLLATSALLGASVGIAGVANAGTLSPNAPNPAPGSITVTLNALIEAFAWGATDSGNNSGGIKRQDYAIGSYARLYPSFDGVLANGIKYGGSMEIRENSGATSSPTMFLDRAFIYFGADKFGKFEIGAPVQPSELFQTGNEVGFDTGGWDGDVNSFFTGKTGLRYMIDDDRDQAEKAVYVSPQFSGFDFGVSFEPNNQQNNFGDSAARVTAGPAGTPTLGNRLNTVDGALRYQGTFGPIGVKGDVAASAGGVAKANDGSPIKRPFSLYGGGAAVTFAGFEVGAHVDSGVYGDDLGNVYSGASGTTGYIGGGQYTFGPVVVGANYYGYSSGEFKYVPGAGELHGWGVAAGGTYTLAPGASVFLEYLFGQQHANDVDMTSETIGSPSHNHVRAQAIGLGSALKW